MRLFLCLRLMLPGLAMAGQDTAPRPVTIRPVTLLRVAPPAMAPRADSGGPAGRAITTAGSPGLCDAAVTSAEFTGRLPPRLLHAISLVESGRVDSKTGVVRAWPWTINAEGE